MNRYKTFKSIANNMYPTAHFNLKVPLPQILYLILSWEEKVVYADRIDELLTSNQIIAMHIVSFRWPPALSVACLDSLIGFSLLISIFIVKYLHSFLLLFLSSPRGS